MSLTVRDEQEKHMPLFDKQIGRMADFLSKADASLKLGDLSNYIWVKFQRSLADGVKPNWWEIRVSSANAEALGGTQRIALDCLGIVARMWAEEGRAEQKDLQDVVLCKIDDAVTGGKADIYAEELDAKTLLRKKVAAEAVGAAVASSLKPRSSAKFAIVCPWNGVRVPVTHNLSIGRDNSNDIVTADYVYVSHVHGQLVRDDDSESGWAYVDLGSTNGSTVNGRKVGTKFPIRPGDRIGLGGSCELVFEEC